MRRRRFLLGALPLGAGGLPGCAGDPGAGTPGAVRPVRVVQGGYLSPTVPGLPALPGMPGMPAPALPGAAATLPGMPPRPGSGMFVRFQMPAALALRGFDLLVADLAANRLWRSDLGFQSLTPLPAAPVGPGTALWIGPDRSAWVLDTPARQVLRFGADGRLLQTWRSSGSVPVGMAVLDGGATIAVADAAWGQWVEWRSGGALALPVPLSRTGGGRVASVDAVAAGGEQLFVLDLGAGAVHRVQRDGRVLETLGAGTLGPSSSLVVDRHERAWVLDAQGRWLTRLASGRAPVVVEAAQLGVQQIGGVAVDDRALAVSDRLAGAVLIHPLPPPGDGP